MAKAFDEAKEREIAGRYMGDMTAVELAAEYHCHERTIREIVHRLGMPNKRKWKLSQQSTPIVEDYQAGVNHVITLLCNRGAVIPYRREAK